MHLHRSFKQVRYLIQLDIIGTYNDLSGTRTFSPIIWWWVQMSWCQISHGMNQLFVMRPYMLLENNASFCYVRKSSDVTWMNVYYCVIMSHQQWLVDWGKTCWIYLFSLGILNLGINMICIVVSSRIRCLHRKCNICIWREHRWFQKQVRDMLNKYLNSKIYFFFSWWHLNILVIYVCICNCLSN